MLEYDCGFCVSDWQAVGIQPTGSDSKAVRVNSLSMIKKDIRSDYRWRNTVTGEIETTETYQSEQPKPQGKGREIAPLVISDLLSRVDKGVRTYGEPLKAHNGRDALRDAYEEALDLCMYLRQAIEENNARPIATNQERS